MSTVAEGENSSWKVIGVWVLQDKGIAQHIWIKSAEAHMRKRRLTINSYKRLYIVIKQE